MPLLNAHARRNASMAALTVVGLLVAAKSFSPARHQSIAWGVTRQLDEMNYSTDVGEHASSGWKMTSDGLKQRDEAWRNGL